MFEVGTPIFANYGAMHPTVNGEITKCNADGTYTVMFDDGAVQTFEDNRLRRDIARPSGSPIGVYINYNEMGYNPNPAVAGDWDDYDY